jgi:hypothetical protein
MWVKQYNKSFNKKMMDWWDAMLQHYDVVPDSELSRISEMAMLNENQGASPMSNP